jgi:thiol-disulfide isomerase/thioredoxin
MRATSAIAFTLVLLSSAVAMASPLEGWEALDEAAKPFVVSDLSGRSLSSANLSGKLVVIDLWATWCAPCVQELPELAALSQRWHSRKDVVLLSFNVSEEKSVVEEFVRQKKVPFPVYLGDPFLDLYDVQIFPTKLIFDFRKTPGTLRFRGEGRIDVPSIEKRVSELLLRAR